MPNTAEFDQRMRLTWRYAAGDGPNNMLDFGPVAMNTTKSDVNSNRPVSGQNSSAPLQYVDVGGSFSAEVFYKFHLDQASTVIISTDHELTNFDTMLSASAAGTIAGSAPPLMIQCATDCSRKCSVRVHTPPRSSTGPSG